MFLEMFEKTYGLCFIYAGIRIIGYYWILGDSMKDSDVELVFL